MHPHSTTQLLSVWHLTQGIVHGTTLTVLNAGRLKLGTNDLAGESLFYYVWNNLFLCPLKDVFFLCLSDRRRSNYSIVTLNRFHYEMQFLSLLLVLQFSFDFFNTLMWNSSLIIFIYVVRGSLWRQWGLQICVLYMKKSTSFIDLKCANTFTI